RKDGAAIHFPLGRTTLMHSSTWLKKVPPLAVFGVACFLLGILWAKGTKGTATEFAQTAESKEEPPAAVVPSASQKPAHRGKSIRDLSQHFNEPNGDISPWMIFPTKKITL